MLLELCALPFLLFVTFPRLSWRDVAGYGLTQGLGQVTPVGFVLTVSAAFMSAAFMWAARVFFAEQPMAQQWWGTAAVLLGLVINQAGAVQTLARSWLGRRNAGPA